MPATRSSARAAVLRSALLFTPFLAIALLGLILIVRDAVQDGMAPGRIVGLALVGGVVLLLGFVLAQSLLDLFSGLVETVGVVERRWSRTEYFLFRNTYIFVNKDVYRLSPEQASEVELGGKVRIVHLPHTTTVETIEVVREPSGAPAS